MGQFRARATSQVQGMRQRCVPARKRQPFAAPEEDPMAAELECTSTDVRTEGKPDIPESILGQWRALLEASAATCCVPIAQIMRAHDTEVELLARAGDGTHRVPPGTRVCRDPGLYCARVMEERQELLVANALEDPAWKDSPAAAQNMVSYLGLPLLWPDGDLFGTICVLDTKENAYSQDIRALMARFRDAVETSLALVLEAHTRRQTQEALDRKVRELQTQNRIMTDRELRMVALKQEVDGLRRQLGLPAKYALPT
jgi:GAF domain-containing protein